jgi:hypothetical protein
MKNIRDYPTVPHEDDMDGMKLTTDQKKDAEKADCAICPDGKELAPGMEKFISFKSFMQQQNKLPKNEVPESR